MWLPACGRPSSSSSSHSGMESDREDKFSMTNALPSLIFLFQMHLSKPEDSCQE